MKRFAFLAIPFAFAACGDNKAVEQPIDAPPTPIDSASIDAPPPIDARVIDAPSIDAPPAVTYSGTVSVLEAALLNPGNSGTFFGQGVQIGISFTASDQVPAPVLEEGPGPTGCKVWVYDRNQAIASSLGVDEGPVQINSPAGTPLYPTCAYVATKGYLCQETSTAGAGGTIAAGPLPMTAKLTVTGTPFNATNSTNRWVNIAGATSMNNNGTFPIVGVADAGATIIYANPGFVAEALPVPSGTHVNLAGIGPTPSAPDPGFLTDDKFLEFVHTMGGGNHVAAYTHTTGGTDNSVADDFILAPGDAQKLNALPRDGSAFTIACDAASCGAGSGTGTILNIITTNGTPSASPFDMPLPSTNTDPTMGPVGRRVQIRCSQIGATSITVPAAYAAYLTPAMTNNATRIQATFIRTKLMSLNPATSISGHAIVGFTN